MVDVDPNLGARHSVGRSVDGDCKSGVEVGGLKTRQMSIDMYLRDDLMSS